MSKPTENDAINLMESRLKVVGFKEAPIQRPTIMIRMRQMMMLIVAIAFAFAAEFINHGDTVKYKRKREPVSGG